MANLGASHTHPLISIVIVVFNGAETLEKSISSVTCQTYDNIELVVIDGGSTDGSLDIIRKFEPSYWKSEPDQGIYDAMNKGLAAATGDWLLFLGCDDFLESSLAIQNCVRHFSLASGIYYGDTYWTHAAIHYPGNAISKLAFAFKNFAHQALFYPKAIYKTYVYDEKYRLYADYVYNLRIYKKYNDQFVYINELVTIYNDRGRSSTTRDVDFFRDRFRLVGTNLGWVYRILLTIRAFPGNVKRMITSW